MHWESQPFSLKKTYGPYLPIFRNPPSTHHPPDASLLKMRVVQATQFESKLQFSRSILKGKFYQIQLCSCLLLAWSRLGETLLQQPTQKGKMFSSGESAKQKLCRPGKWHCQNSKHMTCFVWKQLVVTKLCSFIDGPGYSLLAKINASWQ